MAGFGSSVAAMIASIKNNKRTGKTLYIKDKNNFKKSSNHLYGKLTDHKKLSVSDFNAFKANLNENLKSERNRTLKMKIITLVITVILVITFLLFWKFYDFKILLPQ